jgi:hypothetical protein
MANVRRRDGPQNSYGAKNSLPGKLGYKHLAALRPGLSCHSFTELLERDASNDLPRSVSGLP